jgi:hypothetical protein
MLILSVMDCILKLALEYECDNNNSECFEQAYKTQHNKNALP